MDPDIASRMGDCVCTCGAFGEKWWYIEGKNRCTAGCDILGYGVHALVYTYSGQSVCHKWTQKQE